MSQKGRLKERRVDLIRMRDAGWSMAEIARHFGVTPPAVRLALREPSPTGDRELALLVAVEGFVAASRGALVTALGALRAYRLPERPDA
jgi:lambda repressor-like predicted transcriptional regulator